MIKHTKVYAYKAVALLHR